MTSEGHRPSVSVVCESVNISPLISHKLCMVGRLLLQTTNRNCHMAYELAVWHSAAGKRSYPASGPVSMGWVTVCRPVYHLGM